MLTQLIKAWRARAFDFSFEKKVLFFKKPIRTSRSVMQQKTVRLFFLNAFEEKSVVGYGEASCIPGLSIDPVAEYPLELEKVQAWLSKPATLEIEKKLLESVERYPSLAFGLEMAFLDWQAKWKRKDVRKSSPPYDLACVFDTPFTNKKLQYGIPINGLVWMDSFEEMQHQALSLLQEGYACIKIKIGALDFESELKLLSLIRENEKGKNCILRLDANGAFSQFSYTQIQQKLKMLSQFEIHSIEQPLKPGEYEKTAALIKENIIPIALDEELIGKKLPEKKELLQKLKPHHLVLKPSLLGGIESCQEWISLAQTMLPHCKWWITSALESNVGLNFLSQWTAALALQKNFSRYHGLGTGKIYQNNFPSPLEIQVGKLFFRL